ncbi:MAG: hypothetical protein WDO16_13715 [Bacteroidota bacterium]
MQERVSRQSDIKLSMHFMVLSYSALSEYNLYTKTSSYRQVEISVVNLSFLSKKGNYFTVGFISAAQVLLFSLHNIFTMPNKLFKSLGKGSNEPAP